MKHFNFQVLFFGGTAGNKIIKADNELKARIQLFKNHPAIDSILSVEEISINTAEPNEVERSLQLIELLALESEWAIEKKERGNVSQELWERYNAALDKVCDLLKIDSIEFADMLQDAERAKPKQYTVSYEDGMGGHYKTTDPVDEDYATRQREELRGYGYENVKLVEYKSEGEPK